jgi:subtilase family serine protease
LSASNGAAETVAVVDAYDDPNAEADLAVYRSANNLPACTSSNGCFDEVNQEGVTGGPAYR